MRLMLLILFLLPITTVFAAEVTTLDDFKYADVAALRAAWEPMQGTPPAEFMAHDDRQALKIGCPFAAVPEIERGSFDRKGNLNLMTAGAITFDFYCDDPSLISYCAIYFHSGDGWYGHSFGAVKGWQHVSIAKGTFNREDQPAGWDQVDTIRISAWKAKPVDTFCGLDNLQARTEDITIVSGVASGAEARGVQGFAKQVADFLDKTGVPHGVITDTDVESGALGGQKLALFAYSPNLSAEAIKRTQDYVAGGGKIVVFYTLPGPLAELLGVSNIQYRKAEPADQFARVAFQSDLIGLPATMGQNSWNVQLFEPGGHNAKIIGTWRDAAGKEQGAAVLIGDNGAYMGHVLTGDDPAAKQAFLMALVGHFVPGAWQTAAEVALASAQKIGPFTTRPELDAYLASAKPASPEKIKNALAAAAQAETEYKRLLAEQKYPQSIAAARQLRAALTDAYFYSHRPRSPEFRTVWNHSGTGDCGTWDEAMRLLKAGNFNAVVPNMWWGGLAHYDSKLLPRSSTFDKQGDQIAQCVAAGKKYGIEVHPWKVNWNLTNAPAEFVEKMRAEKRLLVNSKGETEPWLCASNPANQQLEIDTMLEVARNYDVDGIHFDYIRYPHDDGCFCDGCRQRFEEMLGAKVENWPLDCKGKLREQWTDFRCANITRVVKAVSEQAHQLKPNLKVSAAVFGDYPQCRYSIGQDWVLWCKEKYLDFVCPMNYTDSNTRLQNLVTNQRALVGPTFPLYSGIGQFIIPDDQAVAQAQLARDSGADGFILFNMGKSLAEDTLPKFAKGLTSAPATQPHQK